MLKFIFNTEKTLYNINSAIKIALDVFFERKKITKDVDVFVLCFSKIYYDFFLNWWHFKKIIKYANTIEVLIKHLYLKGAVALWNSIRLHIGKVQLLFTPS